MKRQYLKLFIRNIIEESLGQYISSTELAKQTPRQQKVVSDLGRYGYSIKSVTSEGGGKFVIIAMSKSGGRFGGNEVSVGSDGLVSGDASDIPMSYRKGSSDFAIVEKKNNVQRSKSWIRNIVKEAFLREIFDTQIQNMIPKQRQAVDELRKYGFSIQNVIPAKGGITVILLRPKTDDRRPEREAKVMPDGTINEPNIYIKQYLNFLGEDTARVTHDPLLKRGLETPMAFVNVEEGIHEGSPCDCGSSLPSEWEFDGQGIPLVRACDKCRKKKLARYRPEILKPYTQADVDEPIEPEEYEEQTGTGAVAGYSTPFSFKKRKVNEDRKLGAIYWMHTNKNNMVGSRKGNDLKRLLLLAKQNQDDAFAIYKNGSNFHSTTQQEYLIYWYEKSGGYWTNMAKKQSELKAKQIVSLDSINEMIGIDGKYQDDMYSGVTAKKLAGLSESEYEIHGSNCPCGSGLPSYSKLNAIGKPIARVCKRCDRKQRTKIKTITKKPTPIKFDDDDSNQITNEDTNIQEMTGTGAVAGYSTPFAFSKKSKEGSPRAIAAAKKYGKVVKSISTESK